MTALTPTSRSMMYGFLDALFETTNFGETVVFSRFNPNRTATCKVGSWDDIADWVASEERCSYVAVATRGADFVPVNGSRGTAADIASLSCLFLDMDVNDGDGHKSTKGLFESYEQADAFLRAIKIAPSAVVHSGHGYQAYWNLKTPLPATEAMQATNTLHGLIPRIQLALYGKAGKDAPGPDLSVIEPSRVLRLPGTTNTKVDGDHRPTYMVAENYALRYTAEQVIAAFRAAGVDPVVAPTTTSTFQATPSTSSNHPRNTGMPPSLHDFLNGIGRSLHPAALAYLQADIQTRREILRDELVTRLDWTIVSEFEDEYGTGFHMLRPGGSSAQSATIGGCVAERTNWETGEIMEERCISDAMTVWSSAAEPFCSTPEAARKSAPTFDCLHALQLIGAIPEDIPIKATFDATSGNHTYDVDKGRLESWMPSVSPRVIMPASSTFEAVDPFDEASEFDHGALGIFSIDMFPPIVVREARRRYHRDSFLSPAATIMQVWSEAVVACSIADAVIMDGDNVGYVASMNAFLLTFGQPGSGKDGIVGQLDGDYISDLMSDHARFYEAPVYPAIPVIESSGDGDPREATPEEEAMIKRANDNDKRMRAALTHRYGSIVSAAKSPEGLSTASSKTPLIVIASSEGADIKAAFGLKYENDAPSSIANDLYDVRAGRKIVGANQQGRDDRYSSNAALTIVAAVQPTVGMDLLVNAQCREIGLTYRFDVFPLRQLVAGFDDIEPLGVDVWRHVVGLLMSGFYAHAINSAKFEPSDDGGVRVQRWGRTIVKATPEVKSAYNSAVSRTVNSADSEDLSIALRAKRARKALSNAGIWASLEWMGENYEQAKTVPKNMGLVPVDVIKHWCPIVPGSRVIPPGSPEKFRRPVAVWRIERRHFAGAWRMTEAIEAFTLSTIEELDSSDLARSTRAIAREDLAKVRGSVASAAANKGITVAFDDALRAAYEESLTITADDEGWFGIRSNNRALRRMATMLKDLDLEQSHDMVEVRTVARGNKQYRWKAQLVG